MKNIISLFAFCSLILTGQFAMAQDGGGRSNATPEERAQQQTDMMTEKLSLSEKQTEKVGEINLRYANKTSEARKGAQDGDWQAMRETMMKLREEQNAELKNILTTAQFESWQKIQEELRNQRQGRGRPKGDSPQNENKG